MDRGCSSHRQDAPGVTATRGVPTSEVVRNHALFGFVVAVALVAVLAIAGIF